MSFSYDLSTSVGKLRLLLLDKSSTSPQFQDEELQALLDFNSGSLYLAAADACTALARTGVAPHEKIGDYEIDWADPAKQYLDMAERFRMLEIETPAFAVAEENFGEFSEIQIIKNFWLRTEQ